MIDDPIASSPLFFGATHVGRKRSENQDNYLIADLRRLLQVCDSSLTQLDGESVVSSQSGQLLMVADGMGGHAHGLHASQAAMRHMTGYLVNTIPQFLNVADKDEQGFLEALRAGPEHVHQLLHAEGIADPSMADMGTTLTVALITWPEMYVVHVGDSRCYLFRHSELQQLTTDHTIAQFLADGGSLAADPPPGGSLQNMLWNSVSATNHSPKPQVLRVTLEPGDRLLLCSDGLTKHFQADEIASILKSNQSVEDKTNQLIRETNARGGRDNIAVIIGQYNGSPDATRSCEDCGEFTVIEPCKALADTAVEITRPM